MIEKRTQSGIEERQRNKTLLGIDRNSRTKETAHYIAHTSKKANCLTGAIHPVNLMVVQKEGGFGKNSVAVRMPTPIECERLQGFPENGILVPWKDRTMSDTQRYKQTGNAVTVNVIQHIFEALKRHLLATAKGNRASGMSSCFATPLPFPKTLVSRKTMMTQGRYVAFFKTPPKRKGNGLSVASQKAIVNHYAKIDKAEIVAEFSSNQNERFDTSLDDAISFCLKNACTLIVATLDSLLGSINHVFALKKKLDGHLKSCDLPSSDSLTLSIYASIKQRQKDLLSIRTKAAFEVKKGQGITFGTLENLTAGGRKLGLEVIQKNANENIANQKAQKLIVRCRNAGMGFGQIAKELNKNGFVTSRGKQFYKMTVKRLFLKSLSATGKSFLPMNNTPKTKCVRTV